jgi:single-strand DNA-binding protein
MATTLERSKRQEGVPVNIAVASDTASDTPNASIPDRNEVVLTGRLSAVPEPRILPSGDRLVTFRLIVRRSRDAAVFARPGSRQQTVDVVDCTVWGDREMTAIDGAPAGTRLAVRGALRRRFSRTEAGATSWFNVEVTEVAHAADV